MKSTAILLFLMTALAGCQSKVNPSDIGKINGYWEIEKVDLADGSHKDYPINDSYDYYQIKDGKGFRKKVMPQLDGTYLTNDVSEQIKVDNEKGQIFLSYQTPYAKWNEELLQLTDSVMVVRNAQKMEYHYKKTKAINLTGHAQKTP